MMNQSLSKVRTRRRKTANRKRANRNWVQDMPRAYRQRDNRRAQYQGKDILLLQKQALPTVCINTSKENRRSNGIWTADLKR